MKPKWISELETWQEDGSSVEEMLSQSKKSRIRRSALSELSDLNSEPATSDGLATEDELQSMSATLPPDSTLPLSNDTDRFYAYFEPVSGLTWRLAPFETGHFPADVWVALYRQMRQTTQREARGFDQAAQPQRDQLLSHIREAHARLNEGPEY